MAKAGSASDPSRERQQKDESPVCGVVMPISETASHSEQHWSNVQTLLHRAIVAAGFSPRNVWESTSTDRISERIIGNIFAVPIAVIDISDLNPNVMLELGLRLASKKPTVVIANIGGTIPFDIRDFQAIFYPEDMNMLGMEDFFRKLAKTLQDKYKAYLQEKYTPFLGNVIVDVTTPETREVGFNELLLSRLDEVTRRLVSVEVATRRPIVSATESKSLPELFSGQIEAEIPTEKMREFSSEVAGLWEIDGVEPVGTRDGKTLIKLRYSGVFSISSMYSRIEELLDRFGGETVVPF